MAMSFNDDPIKIVQELADGYSRHAKYVNQVWLACIAASTVVMFPYVHDDKYNQLPFSLGLVDKSLYDQVGFFILFVLIMAYCQGFAKAYDANKFAHDQITELTAKCQGNRELRSFYDFFVVDSIARTGPLALLLRNRFGAPTTMAIFFYVILKSITQGILLGLPAMALGKVFIRIAGSNPGIWILFPAILAMIFVVIAITEMVLAEIDVAKRVVRAFKKG